MILLDIIKLKCYFNFSTKGVPKMNRTAMIFSSLTLFLILMGCGPVATGDSILERKTVTNDFFDGTRKYCQLLLETEDKKRISISGLWTLGAAPYDLCQYMREGEKVQIVRYKEHGWYLADARD